MYEVICINSKPILPNNNGVVLDEEWIVMIIRVLRGTIWVSSYFYLLEAELLSIFAETSAADHEAVFSDQAVSVPAIAAHPWVLPKPSWVSVMNIWHPLLLYIISFIILLFKWLGMIKY